MPADEQARRVGHLDQTRVGEVEAADLVDGTEAVLHRPQEPQARRAVALELQDDVDEVLQDAGPGDGAVLRDVADEQGRDALALRALDDRGRDLAHLGDAAGDAVDVGRADGLHGVDHQQARSHLLDVGEQRAEVGLGGEVQLVVDRAGALGTQPHLAGRLLARDVEGAPALPRPTGGELEQQRGLSDPRLAGQE